MKTTRNPWRTPAPWAVVWVISLAILFYLPAGRELADNALAIPLFGGEGILAARYLNAMVAGLLSLRAFRCGRDLDGLVALAFASIFIVNGASQEAAGWPFTVGIALFTLVNILVCWRWDMALDGDDQ